MKHIHQQAKSHQSESVQQGFSRRLRQALLDKNLPYSSTKLRNEFNLRHPGTPVTIGAAAKWLNGTAIPSQDKILTLEAWLGVAAHWLRFGEHVASVASTMNYSEYEQLLLDMRRLRRDQQKSVVALVEVFRKFAVEKA